MRIYIIGNDGVTLCREAPTTVDGGPVITRGTESLRTLRWRKTDSNPRSPMRENQLTRASRLTATGVTPGGPILAPADLWR